MATNRKQSSLTPAVLTDALATYYTVPPGTVGKDLTLDFLNVDTTAAIGITVHLIPSGDTAAAGNQFTSELSPGGFIVGPNDTRSLPLDQALGEGFFVQMKASITGKVTAYVSVTEVN